MRKKLHRINKYLRQYAVTEAESSASLPGSWQHGLVIPACNEGNSLLRLLRFLDTIEQPAKNLVVVVINAITEAPDAVHHQNSQCARDIDAHFQRSPVPGLLNGTHIDVLLVDRYSPGHRLPPKQGVGLARKIGGDILCALYASEKLSSPWFGSTDADAHLPSDYFQRLTPHTPCAAITFPFSHHAVPGFEQAMALYELSLHHYVLGLQWAKSPYAYHTIGSTIATHVDVYASVRGFPKRQAGEDFYYLNKAAKLGPILRADGACIELEGRPSSRVPFGTGPAIQHIQENGPPSMYNPAVFAPLRDLLAQFNAGQSLASYEAQLNPLGYPAFKRHLATHGRTPSILHNWFDGFKTLKFIHQLRDTTHPSMNWHRAIQDAPWWVGPLSKNPISALEQVRSRWYADICGSTSS